MAAATKAALTIDLLDEEATPVRELVARFSGTELLAASRETSKTYNGKVLARALVLVQLRTHCHSLNELGRRFGTGKSIYHWASERPVSTTFLERGLRELAFFLATDGVG